MNKPTSSASAASKKRSRSQRSVAFAPMVTVTETYRISSEEASNVWYTAQDLTQMKYSARALARNHSDTTATTNTATTTRRGLETCSYERQKQRQLSIKCTLCAYRRGMTTEQTAKVSQLCGAWATQQAFVVACHDFAELYRPELLAEIPSVEITPPPSAFPFAYKTTSTAADHQQSKRRLSSSADDITVQRNVRARVC